MNGIRCGFKPGAGECRSLGFFFNRLRPVSMSDEAVSGLSKRILIVDDEQVVCDAIARHLRDAGFDVQVAYSGMTALDVIKDRIFDLALIDIRMPRISGFDVLQALKQKNSEAKAIMMTAFADIKSAVNSISMGASDIISKPVDIDEVILTIQRCFEK
jgi:two-component system, NtrC family, response regulator HydG